MSADLIRKILVAVFLSACAFHGYADSIAVPLRWRIGPSVSAGYVPPSNTFLDNAGIHSTLAGGVRAGFSLGDGAAVYQGIGLDVHTFFAGYDLGTPVSAFVYQGAPITHMGTRLWLGYEWRFGAAFGWHHYDRETAPDNSAIGTPVTAMMSLGLKLHYSLTPRWLLSAGISGAHFSNGNTSHPNAGVNTIGAEIGMSWLLNPESRPRALPSVLVPGNSTDSPWLCDIVAYGAWRKRVVRLDGEPYLCPGKFGVAGIQIAPMRRFGPMFATGISLDMQYDESAGLPPYWVYGTTGDDMKFYRPPFGRQLSIGLSAHAELTMPIFAINVGMGYDMLSPCGNKRFYQSLTLKTFVTRHLFINTGYRLGAFKDPQNLMLGVGVRLGD